MSPAARRRRWARSGGTDVGTLAWVTARQGPRTCQSRAGTTFGPGERITRRVQPRSEHGGISEPACGDPLITSKPPRDPGAFPGPTVGAIHPTGGTVICLRRTGQRPLDRPARGGRPAVTGCPQNPLAPTGTAPGCSESGVARRRPTDPVSIPGPTESYGPVLTTYFVWMSETTVLGVNKDR
jgi:hypothetical protein